MPADAFLGRVEARRRGRGQQPCAILVGNTGQGDVIIRTEDASGIAPIVMVLSASQNAALITLLQQVQPVQGRRP